MQQYLSLIEEILEKGEKKSDRTGTGTISMFGVQRKYDLREGFPLVTTKKVIIRSILKELLWFLKGATNINDGLDCGIWDEWASPEGNIGPLYGYQWVKWEKFEPVDDSSTDLYKKTHINQIQEAIDLIKNNPDSRRILVSAWNVADLKKMALYPCHAFFQFYVVNGRLDCQLYQRSADMALGVPFNIASYSALMIMVAQECNLIPGIFTHTIGDAHIYLNHVEGLREQLARKPFPLPQFNVARKPFWEIKYEDFELVNYEHHPFIKFSIAV